MDNSITVEGQNNNDISVEGRLGGSDNISQSTSDNTNQGSLTGNTVTLKPSNSYLPQTNSVEGLPLSVMGFLMCATIVIGYGILLMSRKKANEKY